MNGNRRNKLKVTYYSSFLILVVIPILCITIVSIAIVKRMMLHSAMDKIELAQKNVERILTEEINSISLRLAHLVHANNNEVLSLAARTDTEDLEVKYNYTKVLSEAFNYVMIPNEDIVASVFYFKDGKYTYMKDDISISKEELEQTQWYQDTLSHKNSVSIRSYSYNITYSLDNRNQFILAAGLAPDTIIDRTNKIEAIMLFAKSRADNLIRDYNKEKDLGNMFLVDSENNFLINMEEEEEELFRTTEKIIGTTKNRTDRRYTHVTNQIPETDWKLISVIDSKILLAEFNKIEQMIIITMLALFLLFHIFSGMFLKQIVHPVNELIQGLKQVENGSLDVHISICGQSEIRTMIHSFNQMVRRLKISIYDNEKNQQKKHEAEIRALQSQINPHFLVNTLSSIRFMAQVSKFDGIKNMAEALMKILSCSFRQNASFYSVKEEIEVLECYIFLMKVRYSDGFEYMLDIQEECMNVQIPRLILQPIVENCIVHGFCEMEDIGQISLRVYSEGSNLYINIEDNGKGITEERIEEIFHPKEDNEDNYNIGISNVYNRLKLNYGDLCEMKIESQIDCYTKTTIKIPIKGLHNEEREHV